MYIESDGGRKLAGFNGTSDCGIRAVAIALKMDYKDTRKYLQGIARQGRQGNGQISKGIYKQDMDTALKSKGWKWYPAPKFQGRKARYSDIPAKRAVLRMANHFSALVDGKLYDTWDSSNKMVYGYWAER